jgi:hypothetical protein
MKTKNLVKRESFVRWYFDQTTKDEITEKVMQDLIEKGKSVIKLKDLFDNAGYIPPHIVIHPDIKMMNDDGEFSPKDCNLIE